MSQTNNRGNRLLPHNSRLRLLAQRTLVATPPRVSRPSDSGVTSSSTMSLTYAERYTGGGRDAVP